MIMCALLNCALEGTRGAWTQRLNSASLKDKKNSRGGNLNWSELVSFNILFSSGGGIRSLQTGGDLGARGVLCRLQCLAKFPQHCCFFFLRFPSRLLWFLHPSASGGGWHHAGSQLPASAAGFPAQLLVRGCSSDSVLVLLEGTCMIWSAAVQRGFCPYSMWMTACGVKRHRRNTVQWSLLSPPRNGQVWDHVEELLWQQPGLPTWLFPGAPKDIKH